MQSIYDEKILWACQNINLNNAAAINYYEIQLRNQFSVLNLLR
jgi:hypothetical protein